jgi:DNA-binding NtrC family response regulator
MITAYRDAEKVVEAFRLGAYDCIFKPFDLKYLRQAITAKLLE